MILVLDNYDSFTYNLVQYLGELGADVRVVRNDEITPDGIAALAPDHIVVSPGPCTPSQAGVSVEAIKTFAGRIPILGVCLGHQSIGQAFGGRVVRADQVMHGKRSLIHHGDAGVLRGLPDPFQFNHAIVALKVAEFQDLSVMPSATAAGWFFFDPTEDWILGRRRGEAVN